MQDDFPPPVASEVPARRRLSCAPRAARRRASDRGGHDELLHNRVHERPHTFLYEKRRASACTLVRAHAECVPRRLLRLKRCTRRKQKMCPHFCPYFLFTCPAPSFHGASSRVASSSVSGRGHCFCSAERAWVAGARAARCPGTSLAASRSPRRTRPRLSAAKKIMPSSNGITRAVALGTGSASARPRAVTENARRRSIWCSQRGLGCVCGVRRASK